MKNKNNFSKDGDTVLISGASSGLGLAISDKLLRSGYNVIGVDIKPSSLKKKRYHHYIGDIANSRARSLLIKKIDDFLSIDVVINNAAIIKPSLYSRLKAVDFDAVMSLNLKSAIFLTQAVLHKLNASTNAPHIFNIGSTAAVNGAPYSVPYVCSKAAINGFTLALNQENSHFGKVKSTCVNLGPMATAMDDQLAGWPGLWKENNPAAMRPEDVAELIDTLVRMRSSLFLETLTVMGRVDCNDRPLENPDVPS